MTNALVGTYVFAATPTGLELRYHGSRPAQAQKAMREIRREKMEAIKVYAKSEAQARLELRAVAEGRLP